MALIDALEENKIRIVKQISNLISNDNSIILSLKEQITNYENDLEDKDKNLDEVITLTSDLEQNKKLLLEGQKLIADHIKNGGFNSPEFEQLLNSLEVNNDVKSFYDSLEEKINLRLTEINDELATLNNKNETITETIRRLKDMLSVAKTSLTSAEVDQAKLREYINQSRAGILNITPRTIESFVKKLTDENGAILFKETMLTTEIIMFYKNHAHLTKMDLDDGKKRPISDVIASAYSTLEEEKVNAEEKEDNELSAIAEAEEKNIDTGFDINLDDDFNETIPSIEDFSEDFMKEFDDVGFNNANLTPTTPEVETKQEEIVQELDEVKVPPLHSSRLAASASPEKIEEVKAIHEYLDSISVTGDFDKDHIIYYGATLDDVKSRMETAKEYGVDTNKLSTTDVKMLLKVRDLKEVLDYAVEHGNEDYMAALNSTTVTKMITTTLNQMSSDSFNNDNANKYGSFSEVFSTLDTINDVTLDPDSYKLYTETLEELNHYCDSITRYAYVINGEYISKQRVEENVKKLVAAKQNLAESDLLFAAIAYNGTKNEKDLVAIADKVFPSPQIGGMVR